MVATASRPQQVQLDRFSAVLHSYSAEREGRIDNATLYDQVASRACRQGISVLYYRCSQLFSDIAMALADGSVSTLKSRLVKPALLLIDDFGKGEINLAVGHVLLDIVDRRMRCVADHQPVSAGTMARTVP